MRSRLYIIGTIALFIITSCVPQPATIATNGADGFGASNKPITGTPWVLPSGVNINFGILTSPANGDPVSYTSSQLDGTLDFYLIFRNSNSQPVTIKFPPGLIFPSCDTILQNSIIVQADSIIVAADSTYYLEMSTFCINDHRTFYYGQTYGTPLVSDNANLTPLLQLIATKKYVASEVDVNILQQAIWDVADSGKLNNADMAAISAFP